MALSKIPSAGFQDNVKFRNLIINGDMSIAQRGTSVTGITTGAYHTVDRIITQISSAGTWTQSQSTDVPSGEGFSNSFKMDCTTADSSLSAGDYLTISQRIEGQNLQYLKKGTSSAESLTLSFWVKSSKTGTYIAELDDRDNTRAISKSYTIDTADTWEKKTLTFAGDTSGALDNDNARSLELNLWLGAGTTFTSGTLATSWETRTNANRAVGQVNLADSTSNDFYITGVQLEAGTTASDFEFLPYDVNQQRCFRYYEAIVPLSNSGMICVAVSYATTTADGDLTYTIKRATPSLDQVTGTAYYGYARNSSVKTFDSFLTSAIKLDRLRLRATGLTGTTAGYAGWLQAQNSSGYLAIDAEL